MTILCQNYCDGTARHATAVNIITTDGPGDLSPSRLLRRSGVALSIKASAILLSSTLFMGIAAAQTPYGTFADSRQLQPTQAQLESTNDKNVVGWNRSNSHVQPELDRLYDEIMRAATPR